MEFLRQLTYDNDNWVKNLDSFETVAYEEEVEFEFDDECDQPFLPLVPSCSSTLSQDSGLAEDPVDPYAFAIDVPSSPLVLRKKSKRKREIEIDDTEPVARKRVKKSCVCSHDDPVTKRKCKKKTTKKTK